MVWYCWILRQLFLNSTNITDSQYRGGGGGGWEAKGRLKHPWAQGQSHHVFSKTHAETATVYLSSQDGR